MEKRYTGSFFNKRPSVQSYDKMSRTTTEAATKAQNVAKEAVDIAERAENNMLQ